MRQATILTQVQVREFWDSILDSLAKGESFSVQDAEEVKDMAAHWNT